MKKTLYYFSFVLFLVFISVSFSGCSRKTSFQKGDIKNDFCGVYINFQYCKCAFHNEFCDSIGMSRSNAKSYVNSEYKKWVDSEKETWAENCILENGVVKGNNCVYCGEGEISDGGKCVESEGSEPEGQEEDPSNESVACVYDSDCDPICEGDVKWKMGCNPRTDSCEKTFDDDCSQDVEYFGSLSFGKTCRLGACVRNQEAIEEQKSALLAEKEMWSQAVKQINSSRADINIAMLEANKNCINGIADMTNVAIMEFSTRVASILAGGIPDIAAMTATVAEKSAGLIAEHVKNLAGAAVDYAGEGINRLYNYQSGEPKEEEKKLKPHEYIKLNCDLYEYFKNVLAESDADLEQALTNAREADEKLRMLP